MSSQAPGARRLVLWMAALFLLAAGPAAVPAEHAAQAQGAQGGPQVALAHVASGLSAPLFVTTPPDGSGRIFVVERTGRIRIVSGGQTLATPFIDVSGLIRTTGSEQGLLGLAFHPSFAANGRFFIYYTAAGNGANTLARYQVSADPNQADAGSASVLFALPDPFSNHNGGMLAFGPDGYLYVAMGDSGGAGDPDGNAQNLETLFGALLRLDVDAGNPYAVPPNNPFAGQQGARGEIWAYGLRNPWRFSFDRQTGELYIADVGQNDFEEINHQPAGDPGGQNYGWNRMEGLHCFQPPVGCDQSGLTMPIFEYDHSQNDCSITGGHVYRGTAVPALNGAYLYGDFCTGRIWSLSHNGGNWVSTPLLDTGLLISSFGEDQDGEIYLTDLGGGAIYRIDPVFPVPTPTAATPTRTPTPTPSATPTSTPTPSGSIGGRDLRLSVAADGTTHLTWTGGTLQTGYLLFELGQPEPGLTVLAANQQAHTLGPPLAALSCYLLAPIVEVDPPAVSDLLCALRGVQVGFTPASLGIGLGGTSLASLSWPATSGQQGYLLLPLGSAPLPLDASATGATQPISAPTCFVLAPLVAGQVLGVTNGVCAIPGVGTLSGARDSIARGRAGL